MPPWVGQWYRTHLVVYADGRVLWWHDLRGGCENPRCVGSADYVLERRLTPEGVGLVRSGVELRFPPPGGFEAFDGKNVPDSAWADATARLYAPPRYSICFWGNGAGDLSWPEISRRPLLPAVDLLPEPARALLHGSDPDPLHPGCLVMSTEDARAFYDTVSGMGLDPAYGDPNGRNANSIVTPGDRVGTWLLRDAEPILGEPVGIYLRPLWPDGDWHELGGA